MIDARPDVIIAGGGLAGGLAALALAERRPDLRLLLIEQEHSFGGNHIWSFFDSDIDASDRPLLEPIIARRWPDHEIFFPRRQRRIAIGYNSISSGLLDAAIRKRLAPDRYRLGCTIEAVAPDHVIVAGERIEADCVIDARGGGGGSFDGLDLAWQKFVGRSYRFRRGHGVARPTIMDARVPQRDGYRFVYRLPFTSEEMLVEDTYYADGPSLDRPALAEGLDRMADEYGECDCIGEEAGVLPILLAGEIETLWPAGSAPVPRLGMRGGFFHPTTGYSLPDAVRNARLISAQPELRSESLFRLLHAQAARDWKDRRFFQRLNRMLFRAARPGERYRVLEHFYRLPEITIARFYGARLRAFDKVRILTGRPPVPIGRALAALRSAAA